VAQLTRLVWKGRDDDTRLFSAVTPDGVSWGRQAQAGTDRGSSDGPGLAAVEGMQGFPVQEFVMAWRGIGEDSRLFFSLHSSGGWTPQRLVGDAFTSTDGPALAVAGRNVLMAWKAAGDAVLLWSQFDGSEWSAPEALAGGSSSHAPAIVGSRDQAIAAWKGQPGDSRLFISHFDGRRWSAQEPVAEGEFGTSHRPALGVLRGRVLLAWKGRGDDRRLFFSERRGSQWQPQAPILNGAFGSEHGPALGRIGDRLGLVWRGTGPDTRMFSAIWDGSSWSGQRDVLEGGAGTSHGPALAAITQFDL
jgi:hypothetical protein